MTFMLQDSSSTRLLKATHRGATLAALTAHASTRSPVTLWQPAPPTRRHPNRRWAILLYVHNDGVLHQ